MAGDPLTDMIACYGRLIRSVVVKVARTSDPDIGDEIEQRVAESLLTQVRREQDVRHPTSYIYRCAVRETLRELARRRGHDSLDAVEGGLPAASTASPEEEASGRELAAATEACLRQLPADRAAAARAHLAGFPVEEIMQVHGWPYQKARNLVARGMADLRRLLGEQGFDDR